jgi:hypothetical protein
MRVSLAGLAESNVIVTGSAARTTGSRYRLVTGHLRPARRYAEP